MQTQAIIHDATSSFDCPLQVVGVASTGSAWLGMGHVGMLTQWSWQLDIGMPLPLMWRSLFYEPGLAAFLKVLGLGL